MLKSVAFVANFPHVCANKSQVMKIVYIAHPISGDQKGNVDKVLSIIREINLSNLLVVPFAPYIPDCLAMNDEVPYERARGIQNDVTLFNRLFIDEVWLYGDRISTGMSHEIQLAFALGIPVFPKTDETKKAYSEIVWSTISEQKKSFNEGKQKPNLKIAAKKAEAETIINTLRHFNFNKTKTAIALGVDRKTLYNKMDKLGIIPN